MKLLTKHTDYALQALLYIAQHGSGPVSSREISEGQQLPLPFLRQILKKLAAHGILATQEGVTGGFTLIRDPDTITVEEILRIFQGPVNLTECLFRRQLCPHRGQCVLRTRLKNIEEKVTREFRGMTLGGLLRDITAQE